MKNHKNDCSCCFCKNKRGEQISHRKGLSLEQEYGKEKAEKIRISLKNSHSGVCLSEKHRHSLSLAAQKRKEKQNGRMNKQESVEKMRKAAILQFKDQSQRELRRKARIRCMSEQKHKGTLIEEKVKNLLIKNNINYIDQFAFKNKYVCDFALIDYKIIIECDGCWYHGCKQCCKTLKTNIDYEYQKRRDTFIKENN